MDAKCQRILEPLWICVSGLWMADPKRGENLSGLSTIVTATTDRGGKPRSPTLINLALQRCRSVEATLSTHNYNTFSYTFTWWGCRAEVSHICNNILGIGGASGIQHLNSHLENHCRIEVNLRNTCLPFNMFSIFGMSHPCFLPQNI